MSISISLNVQNGKTRLFIHNNYSPNKRFKHFSQSKVYPSPSPSELPMPPKSWTNNIKYKTDPALALLDKFTQISLDQYWKEIVHESCMNSSLITPPHTPPQSPNLHTPNAPLRNNSTIYSNIAPIRQPDFNNYI